MGVAVGVGVGVAVGTIGVAGELGVVGRESQATQTKAPSRLAPRIRRLCGIGPTRSKRVQASHPNRRRTTAPWHAASARVKGAPRTSKA